MDCYLVDMHYALALKSIWKGMSFLSFETFDTKPGDGAHNSMVKRWEISEWNSEIMILNEI